MATRGEKEIITDYPNDEDGLVLGTNKLDGREMRLIPQKSNVPERYKKGV